MSSSAESPRDASRELAQSVRDACVQAALDGYEQAGMSGLCAEGRWEMAIDAIRSLDLETLLRRAPAPH